MTAVRPGGRRIGAVSRAMVRDPKLRRGLTPGDPTPFFTRPISAVICLIIVFTILMSIPAVSKRVRAIFSRSNAESPAKG